jgi:hypothetical protein
MGAWFSSQSWLMWSKHPFMSASNTHWAEAFLDIQIRIWAMASAVERLILNPYEFGSLVDSATGSRASRNMACIALSRMVGIPRGRSFPLALGIKTLRSGRGLYPRRSNPPTASHRLSGESHSSRSTPAVRAPWFCVTRRTAYSFADNVRVSIRCRAFTRRHLPSRVAFAIRICIPLTFRSTRRQSTACQLSSAWESADPPFRVDTFMLLSLSGKKIPDRRRISRSHVLTISASLAPCPLLLRVSECSPRGVHPPEKSGGYIVRRASHPTVTSDACLPRLRLAVQTVHYRKHLRSNNDGQSFTQ